MSEAEEGQVGAYQLLRKIGRGGMGTVYEALDGVTGRRVAVKLLSGELSGDEELAERFRREALAVAHLEQLTGTDLKVLIEGGHLGPLPQRLRIMGQAASGMGFVHAKGLVHRDLKPGNIHVTPEGVAKIMDFGLVRLGDSDMTRTGMVMGSPAYMSPEQLKGEKADARSDVFALGAVFYELLSGRRAFTGKGLTEIMMAVITKDPLTLAEVAPETPVPVAMVVARCLRKNPKERYRTAGELEAALDVLRAAYGDE